MKFSRSFIALCAVAVVIAGCGGGSEAALTKAEWIARADGICDEESAAGVEMKREVAKGARSKTQVNSGEIANALRESASVRRPFDERLRRLPAPRGDEATISHILDTVEEPLASIDRMADAVEESNREQFASAEAEARKSGKRMHRLEAAYGLKVCGQGR